jgi:hypothetical protein
MVRKGLAVILVVSWVILSGFDVLEDLNFPSQTELHASAHRASSASGHFSRWANNIVESAEDSESCHEKVLEQLVAQRSAAVYTAKLKSSKLHKLYRVYLI